MAGKIKRSKDTPAYMELTLGSRIFDTINLILLLLIASSCIVPLWYTLCISLSDKSSVAAGYVTFWPRGFNFSSYAQIMGDAKFLKAFWVSIMRVFLGTGITMVVVILMSYPLSKSSKEFPARNVLMWILVFCMLFSGGLIPWFETVKGLHLTNTIWALVFGGGLPVFYVILMVNFFRNLPRELEEAAVVDGAGPWYLLFKIIIPVSKPVIATVLLFTAVYHWNEFFNGLVLINRADKYPLQTYIQQLVVIINTSALTEDQYKRMSELSNQTLNAAKIFIAMIPVLAVYPFVQKYFITGITLGAVKG